MFRQLLTLQFSLLSIVAFSQSMNTYTNREEIVTRLGKYLHPDNLGLIEFYDASSREKVKDLVIDITEQGPEKLNINNLVIKGKSGVTDLTDSLKHCTYNLLKDGGVSFTFSAGKDYQICLKQDGYIPQQYTVNWRELLLNKEVGLIVNKLDCKSLTGLVSSKNVLFDLSDLNLRLLDKVNKEEKKISMNAWGSFNLFLEYNKAYLLEFYEGDVKKHTIELPVLCKDHSFDNVISKTKDFDFVLQESTGSRIIIPTKHWTNTDFLINNYNKQELLQHFLDNNAAEIRKGIVFQLSNYSYDYVKLEFSEQSKKEFALLDQLLHMYPGMKISINVHTDSEGSNSFNQRFTYDIAEKISRILSNRGIDKNRILSRGMGEAFPLLDTDPMLTDKEKDLRNRRVEVEILEF